MNQQDQRETNPVAVALVFPTHPKSKRRHGINIKAKDAWLKAGWAGWKGLSEDAGISASVGLSSIHQSGGNRLPFPGL